MFRADSQSFRDESHAVWLLARLYTVIFNSLLHCFMREELIPTDRQTDRQLYQNKVFTEDGVHTLCLRWGEKRCFPLRRSAVLLDRLLSVHADESCIAYFISAYRSLEEHRFEWFICVEEAALWVLISSRDRVYCCFWLCIFCDVVYFISHSYTVFSYFI